MQSLKQVLTDANIEIYGEEASTLRIAERHRFHLMDSGVEVRVARGANATEPSDPIETTETGASSTVDAITVAFALRAERTDFPHVEPALIFDRIREALGADMAARSYVVSGERIVDVHDPIDSQKVLDVWYELEFAKAVADPASAVEEIRWALTVDKYVKPA